MATCPKCLRENHYQSDGLCKICYTKLHNERKIATDWLLNYTQRRHLAEQSQELTMIGAAVSDGMPHGSDVSNPTASKAARKINLDNAAAWIKTCDDVFRNLDEPKQNLLKWRGEAERQERDCAGRPGWYEYVERKFYEEEEYCPLRDTLFKWWSDIVTIAIRIAIEYKAL